jgi:hypothetical protein
MKITVCLSAVNLMSERVWYVPVRAMIHPSEGLSANEEIASFEKCLLLCKIGRAWRQTAGYIKSVCTS